MRAKHLEYNYSLNPGVLDKLNKIFSDGNKKIAEKYGDEIVVAKVNIDDEGILARREGIEVIPTLVLYKAGMELGSMVAPESGAAIQEFLRQNL